MTQSHHGSKEFPFTVVDLAKYMLDRATEGFAVEVEQAATDEVEQAAADKVEQAAAVEVEQAVAV